MRFAIAPHTPFAGSASLDSGRLLGYELYVNKRGQRMVTEKKKTLSPMFPTALAMAGTLGLHIVTGSLVGVGIGYFLDQWLGTSPWLMLFFLIIGTCAGYKNMLEDLRRLDRAEKETGETSVPSTRQ